MFPWPASKDRVMRSRRLFDQSLEPGQISGERGSHRPFDERGRQKSKLGRLTFVADARDRPACRRALHLVKDRADERAVGNPERQHVREMEGLDFGDPVKVLAEKTRRVTDSSPDANSLVD